MGSAQSHEGGDEADLPRDLDSDVREMYAIGEPASGSGPGPSQSGGGGKRSRRQTRHASAKSAAKSKGSYATVRKTRRR